MPDTRRPALQLSSFSRGREHKDTTGIQPVAEFLSCTAPCADRACRYLTALSKHNREDAGTAHYTNALCLTIFGCQGAGIIPPGEGRSPSHHPAMNSAPGLWGHGSPLAPAQHPPALLCAGALPCPPATSSLSSRRRTLGFQIVFLRKNNLFALF